MAKRLTTFILLALLAGLATGLLLHALVPDPASRAGAEAAFAFVTKLFLRLVKMIIAPLVFATLVGGIAHLGSAGGLGRMGARALGWFVGASFVSLLIGLIFVSVIRPGVGALDRLPAAAGPAVPTPGFDLDAFLTHLVPQSIVEAMAGNEILQIVIFALFFGVALNAAGEVGRPIARGVDALAQVMLKVTDYVMRWAPAAVFAAVAAATSAQGPRILVTYGWFIGGFYLALLALWTMLAGAGVLLGGARGRRLLRLLRAPALLAFSTASSEAALPQTLEALDEAGVPRRVSGFVLPLGYSFNLDGSMMYCTFAILFIAQAYGRTLSLGQELTMLLLLMVTSKGMAGVPRASLVVISAALATFGLPAEGLALILAVDHFLDMGRSATNVLGNAIASLAVARWEGALEAWA